MALTMLVLALVLACTLGIALRAAARLGASVRALRVEAREWRGPGESDRTA